MFLKKLTLLFVAMAVAVSVAIPASAKTYQQKLEELREYAAKLEAYHSALDIEYEHQSRRYHSDNEYVRRMAEKLQRAEEDLRVAKGQIATLEAENQRLVALPAGEFVPAPAPPVVVEPIPVPVWGYGYYRYYDYELCDWIFARVWCHQNWRVPNGWILVSSGDRVHFRHFAQGRVDGGRLRLNRQPQWQFQPRGNVPVVRKPQMRDRPISVPMCGPRMQPQARLQAQQAQPAPQSRYIGAQGAWRR